jgi:hypothetical protein
MRILNHRITNIVGALLAVLGAIGQADDAKAACVSKTVKAADGTDVQQRMVLPQRDVASSRADGFDVDDCGGATGAQIRESVDNVCAMAARMSPEVDAQRKAITGYSLRELCAYGRAGVAEMEEERADEAAEAVERENE